MFACIAAFHIISQLQKLEYLEIFASAVQIQADWQCLMSKMRQNVCAQVGIGQSTRGVSFCNRSNGTIAV